MPYSDALNASVAAPRRPSPVVLPSPRTARICATAIVGGIMFLLASGVPAPAFAQTQAPQAQTTTPPAQTGACEEPPHTAATPPARGADSGTKPGSEGSTAWTGGTGGSYTGLTPHAGTQASPTRQPDTVSGVNPKPELQGRC
jgi:hypothetical protein